MDKPVLMIAGTRPEAIKLCLLFKWFRRLNVDIKFVWSGQHYDYELSKVFFEELGLPDPDLNLDVGSGSHSVQTAKVMLGVEAAIKNFEPLALIAEGDTNSVAATALASAKAQVPFAHVEAGLRSYDRTMPEEINRIIADSCSELLFAPTVLAVSNLAHEGIPARKIVLTGNPIVDVVNEYRRTALKRGRELLEKLNIRPDQYLLVTLHRQENTDNPSSLLNIVKAILHLGKKCKVVFPVHPRTMNKLKEIGLLSRLQKQKLTLLSPLGYFEFLGLMLHGSAVLTDSGGVQEEAYTLHVPTVTLRNNTERPETTLHGTNVLAGTESKNIVRLTEIQLRRAEEIRTKSRKNPNPLGNGNASRRIVFHLKNALEKGLKVETSDTRKNPYVVYRIVANRRAQIERLGKGTEIITAYDANGYSSCLKCLRRQNRAVRLLVRTPMREVHSRTIRAS